MRSLVMPLLDAITVPPWRQRVRGRYWLRSENLLVLPWFYEIILYSRFLCTSFLIYTIVNNVGWLTRPSFSSEGRNGRGWGANFFSWYNFFEGPFNWKGAPFFYDINTFEVESRGGPFLPKAFCMGYHCFFLKETRSPMGMGTIYQAS